VLVPDLAGWRRATMPRLPATAAFEIAPDWVCEVVSPRTGKVDRNKKMGIYARAGVGHLWLIDPARHSLEVFRRRGRGWALSATHEGAASVRAEPFAAIEIKLARLWPDEGGTP
jgi:Uma2 family endonuclease